MGSVGRFPPQLSGWSPDLSFLPGCIFSSDAGREKEAIEPEKNRICAPTLQFVLLQIDSRRIPFAISPFFFLDGVFFNHCVSCSSRAWARGTVNT